MNRDADASPVRLAQPIGLVAGVWLMAAPAIFDYAGSAVSDIHRTVGPVVASCAVIAWWPVVRAVRWVNAVAAGVLFVTTILVTDAADASVIGIVTAIALGVVTPAGGTARQRTGTGWRATLVSRGNEA